MEDKKLTLKRKRIMIYFVEAAKQLIQSEGIGGLTIRKVASEAGYNSATIYNYFENLEHLTLFASVCYMRDYVLLLGKSLREDMTALERYRTIYHCFNEFAFQYPEIFHNMFYGKYSHMLGNVLRTYYYELFPEELEGISKNLQNMLVGGSMKERDRITMKDMVAEGSVASGKAEMTLELITAVHQKFIYEASVRGDQLDMEQHKKKFDEIFEFVIEMAK